MLSACAAGQQAAAPAENTEAPPGDTEIRAETPAASAPPPAAAAARPAPPRAESAAPKAEAATARAGIDTGALKGMSGPEITRLLGAPSFERRDDPAALWQYRGRDCILDLFLYADGPAYRVTYVMLRRREGSGSGEKGPNGTLTGPEKERCLAALFPAGGVRG